MLIVKCQMTKLISKKFQHEVSRDSSVAESICCSCEEPCSVPSSSAHSSLCVTAILGYLMPLASVSIYACRKQINTSIHN